MPSKTIPLCAPSLLFLILSIISIIILLFNKTSLIISLLQLLFIIIWTWVLNFLCVNGYTVVSWILVILPFIFLIITIMLSINAINNLTNEQLDYIINNEGAMPNN